jgi:hypothetical protein
MLINGKAKKAILSNLKKYCYMSDPAIEDRHFDKYLNGLGIQELEPLLGCLESAIFITAILLTRFDGTILTVSIA